GDHQQADYPKRGRDYEDARADKRDLRASGDPELSDDVTEDMLDPAVRTHLKTLARDNAEVVARHLVMAGALLDVDPATAHEHALAAQRHAARVGVVREALAMTAYRTGNYNLALREIHAFRRLTGTHAHEVIEADCERGMGRPERALEIIAGVDRERLTDLFRVELTLVESGARSDLGEHEAGLILIEDELTRHYSPDLAARLTSVKADRLAELGRDEEAASARERAEALDPEIYNGSRAAEGDEVDEDLTIVEDEA
ncbi:MAG: hypothetical protein Q4P36_09070, partial [Bowdeniella nasicola]|nr:hypothetical protein [Bowdeniella nasicola]